MSLNVGHFVIKFPSKREKIEIYGSERITYVLCKELVNIGNNVDVFVPYTKAFDEMLDGIAVHFCKSIVSVQGYKISPVMLRRVMNFNLDIVHVHNDSPMAMLAGLKYAREERKPLVVTWHGDWLGANKIRKISAFILNRTLVRMCLSQASAIIVPSIEYVKQSNVLGEFRDKIVEIPHGVNLEELRVPYSKEESRELLGLDDDKIIVLYLSAVCEGKGAGLLLRAASKVLRYTKDVQFVFVGGGEINKYRELAGKIGIDKYVRFTGYVNENIKLLYYNSADIFVFPSMSKHEVFPVVTIESAAFALPIILSDLNIFKNRIIDRYNGIYFRSGDENDLVEKILSLLEDKNLRNKIGRHAKIILEKYYSSKRMAKLTYKLYLSVI